MCGKMGGREGGREYDVGRGRSEGDARKGRSEEGVGVWMKNQQGRECKL